MTKFLKIFNSTTLNMGHNYWPVHLFEVKQFSIVDNAFSWLCLGYKTGFYTKVCFCSWYEKSKENETFLVLTFDIFLFKICPKDKKDVCLVRNESDISFVIVNEQATVQWLRAVNPLVKCISFVFSHPSIRPTQNCKSKWGPNNLLGLKITNQFISRSKMFGPYLE